MTTDTFIAKHGYLLVILAITIGGWIFVYAETTTSIKGQMDQQKTDLVQTQTEVKRIDDSGSHGLNELKIVVDNHTRDIIDLRTDSKQTERDVTEIKANLSVVASKLDNLTDMLKAHMDAWSKVHGDTK